MDLSIPFYWDFPLKQPLKCPKCGYELKSFNSLLLGFSVETVKREVRIVYRDAKLSIPFYWDFPLKL